MTPAAAILWREMVRMLARRHVFWIVPALLLFAVGCNAPNTVVAGPPRGGEHAPGGLLAVPQAQLAHLKIGFAETVTWPTVVHTTGTVDWNANRTTPAITQVSGPIVRILADPGEMVTEGQALLYVTSPDVSNAIAAYKKARNRQSLAQRVLARNALLLEHEAIARKDYESAEADLNDAGTDVQNSVQALKIFGVSPEEIDSAEHQGGLISPQLAVRAPISGTVVQKQVAPGQLIQAGSTTCYVISDISSVWVQGHIFDHDLPLVRVGDTVEERNPSFPTVFHGVVEYIGAMLDPATRTTPVRIVTRNPGGLLKKDMFVDAEIHTRTRRNVLAVPTSAVLRDAQNEPFVYVQAQPGRFARRPITTGGQQDGRIEIVSGLRRGERVVSEGSVFLQFANSYE